MDNVGILVESLDNVTTRHFYISLSKTGYIL